MARPIRLLVLADDTASCPEVRRAFERDPRIEVVAEAHDDEHAAGTARAERIDVAVVALRGVPARSIEATRRIAQESPEARIVVLADVPDEDAGLAALRAGAVGYLPADANPDVVVRIVRDVAEGKAAISRRLTLRLIERYRRAPESASGLRPVRSELTTREWEVLDLLAEGASTVQVADELGLSIETVRSHVKRLLRKLGVHSRREAIERSRDLRTLDGS